jgi:hypothetical protein
VTAVPANQPTTKGDLRFDVILITALMVVRVFVCFPRNRENHPKIQMESQKTQIVKTMLKKKYNLEGFTLPDYRKLQ